MAAVDTSTYYAKARELCKSDVDPRSRLQPAEDAQEPIVRQADAAVRRLSGVHVQEDRRATAGHGRVVVRLDQREGAVRDGLLPKSLAAVVEGRLRPARNMHKAVVARRCGVLVPPVAADEAVEAQL